MDQKLLSLILALVQRSKKAQRQNKNMNLDRQINSLRLLPMKHPSSNSCLQGEANLSQWQRQNQLAYSGIRQPDESFVYSLWAVYLVKQLFRYFLKIRRMKINSYSSALSILFTNRERNFANIWSITTAFIPLSRIFYTCTLSLQAPLVNSSISFLSSSGKALNSSSTEQLSCLVAEQPLKVLMTYTNASSGVLIFFSYSFSGSSLVTIIDLVSPPLGTERSPGAGALP